MADSESAALTGLGDTPAILVRSMRVELIRVSPLPPQSSASTSSATTAPIQIVISDSVFLGVEELTGSEEMNHTTESARRGNFFH